jgi:hypothetical protein
MQEKADRFYRRNCVSLPYGVDRCFCTNFIVMFSGEKGLVRARQTRVWQTQNAQGSNKPVELEPFPAGAARKPKAYVDRLMDTRNGLIFS